MTSSALSRAVVMFAVVGYAAAAGAHHSFQAEFDVDKQVEVTGTVTEVDFAHPHVHYVLEVESGGDDEQWTLQYHNPRFLRHQGWTEETLRVGDQVAARGSHDRNGANRMYLECVRSPDGEAIGGCASDDLPGPLDDALERAFPEEDNLLP